MRYIRHFAFHHYQNMHHTGAPTSSDKVIQGPVFKALLASSTQQIKCANIFADKMRGAFALQKLLSFLGKNARVFAHSKFKI